MFKKWVYKIEPVKVFYLLLFFEFINISYYFYYLSSHSYLPAPFLYDSNDTLMDFYTPLFWVIKDGFYTTFNSVYPALNYYFLKIFAVAVPANQVSNAFQLRDQFPVLGLIVSFLYVLIIWVAVNVGEWRKIHFIHRGLIFLACLLSVPVLFGLERGNLIFLALLFLALYLNASNPWFKAIFLGLLINVKPYFVILLLPYLNFHQFNKVELIRTILITAVIFFGLGLLVELNLSDFFKAYLGFAKKGAISIEGVVALPHSIAALSAIKALVDFGTGSAYTFWFSLLKGLNYASVVLLLCTALFKKLTPLELFIASMIMLTNFSISTGGYILIIYIVLIPYLLQSIEYKKLLIFILLIFALPLDWINFLELKNFPKYSYIGGNIFIGEPSHFLAIGSIFRPLFNFSLMIIFLVHLYKKYSRIINAA